MSDRKKIYGKLLIGLTTGQLVLPLVIFLTVMAVKYSQWREIRSNEETKHYETIVISNSEGKDYKAGDELRLNGALYDIKSVSRSGKGYIITALADKLETKLDRVNTNIFGSSERSDEPKVKVLPFVFLYHEAFVNWMPLFKGGQLEHTLYSSPYLPYHPGSVLKPPPQAVLAV